MLLPILNVDSEEIPERVLVVGEPTRARRAATRLEAAVEITITASTAPWSAYTEEWRRSGIQVC